MHVNTHKTNAHTNIAHNQNIICTNTTDNPSWQLQDNRSTNDFDTILFDQNFESNCLQVNNSETLISESLSQDVYQGQNLVENRYCLLNVDQSNVTNISENLSDIQTDDNNSLDALSSQNEFNQTENNDVAGNISCDGNAVHEMQEPTISIVNWNVNGLINRLTDPDFIDYILSFDVCILTETFTLPTFDFNVHFNDYICFHSPAVKLSKMGHCSGGVVIFVRKQFSSYVEQIDTNIDNVLCIRISKTLFGSYNDVLLFGVYNHDVTSVFYKKKYYNCTLDLLEDFMLCKLDENISYDFLIIGDLNSRISDWSLEDDILNNNENDLNLYDRKSEDKCVNTFGKKLIQLCTLFELTPVNGLFHFEFDECFTFISERGNSVIDYYLSSVDFIPFVKRLNVENRIDTHHMPVVVHVNNAINSPPSNNTNQESIHSEKLKWDPSKLAQYKEFMSSDNTKLRLLEAIDQIDVDINSALDSFMNIIIEGGNCMKQKISFHTSKKNSKPWYDNDCRTSKRDANKALRNFRLARSTSTKTKQKLAFEDYSHKKSVYENTKNDKRKAYKHQMVSKLIHERNNDNGFWSCINKLKPRERKDVDIKMDIWKNHFSGLLGANTCNVNQSENDDLLNNDNENVDYGYDINDLDGEITEAEVRLAIKKLKNNKAAGLDGVSSEFLKAAEDSIVPFLTKLFNNMFNIGYFPEKWCQSVIMPLFKKGDHNLPDNYRGISLINVTSKIFTSIVNKRLYTWSEKENKICDEQAGFRRKFSTIDQIYALITIIRKCLFCSRKGKLYVVFVDYMKAFDSVNRDKLWQILKKIKTSPKMLNMLKGIYVRVQSCVRWKSDLSEFFDCPLGVKQGCILSPLIFSLFVNEVANAVSDNCKHGFQFCPGLKEICLLLFADDICLFSTTPSGLQNQIDNLEKSSKALGLKVNLNKTKVMVFRKGGHLSKHEKWFYNGEQLEIVNSYKYLGFTLSTRLSFDIALEEFSGRAKKKVIDIIRTLYSLGSINVNIFFKLFDAQVKPMLLYASEIWGLTRFSVIESVHLFACKRILNVSRMTPNTMVYGELGRHPLFIDSTISAIRYYFRIKELDENRFPKQAMYMERQMMNVRQGTNGNFESRHSWLASIKICFETYGFADVFLGITNVGDVKRFCKIFKMRMIDCFQQDWHNKLTSSERFNMYCSFKDSLLQEYYLSCITISKFRSALTKFRLGINDLNVNNRYRNNTQLCPFCENVENETHFLLQCYKYDALREKYIWKHFDNRVHVNVVIILQKDNVHFIRDIAMYIYHALKLREDTLSTFICL